MPSVFYLIVSAGVAQLLTCKRFDNEDEARDEAQRMCATTGKPFFVLETVALVKAVEHPTEWVELDYDEEEIDA
jgi:hypothetical protein